MITKTLALDTIDSTIFFCSKVADFIEKTGGYVWLTDHLNELPDYERKFYMSAINAIYVWANTLLNNIKSLFIR